MQQLHASKIDMKRRMVRFLAGEDFFGSPSGVSERKK
jgi:hypothetical protein